MHVAMATEPAGPDHPNEDFVGATSSGVVLLDGAGSGALETGCRHGVAWFAHQLGGSVLARLDDHQLDLVTVLAEAIQATADIHRSTCDLLNPATPSATVVVVRDTGDHIEHLVLSDSVLLLASADGSVKSICDDREGQIGERYRGAMDAAANGTDEHTRAREDYLRSILRHRNASGGFWVAAADPQAAHEALTGSEPRRTLQAAAILSDGASRLVDRFALTSWLDIMITLRDAGPAKVIKRVRDAERSDAMGVRWPRGKAYDDATIAVLGWDQATRQAEQGAGRDEQR